MQAIWRKQKYSVYTNGVQSFIDILNPILLPGEREKDSRCNCSKHFKLGKTKNCTVCRYKWIKISSKNFTNSIQPKMCLNDEFLSKWWNLISHWWILIPIISFHPNDSVSLLWIIFSIMNFLSKLLNLIAMMNFHQSCLLLPLWCQIFLSLSEFRLFAQIRSEFQNWWTRKQMAFKVIHQIKSCLFILE